MIDALSQKVFEREMPKTHNWIQSHSHTPGVWFNKPSIVGANSGPNQAALFSGWIKLKKWFVWLECMNHLKNALPEELKKEEKEKEEKILINIVVIENKWQECKEGKEKCSMVLLIRKRIIWDFNAILRCVYSWGKGLFQKDEIWVRLLVLGYGMC